MKYSLPADYHERVYAGVLGKIIGVYLGRPFEQWSHERIVARWGEIRRYVHADLGLPLVVTDDDITGTFTFVRALADHPGAGAELSSRQIGQSWLNYVAEGKHVFWWGGMGMSTEHTAYLRLAAGVEAPESGSIELNGQAVAEEIGAQIFIDGWALVSPGQPEQAVRLARAAGSVSHDGEAVHAAAMLAAMESLAFVEGDIFTLIERGLEYVPPESEVARVTANVRVWHRAHGADWKRTLACLQERYGYQVYGTNCPAIPNFGIILLALLHGEGDFSESMAIVNTAGYDTDCNAGNLGCLLGVRGGLDVLSDGAFDWRTPINDQLFLPAADGHRGVSDAATVAVEIINLGRRLAGEVEAFATKEGARYHFDLPGSTHGFALPLEQAGQEAVRADMTPAGERALLLTVADNGRAGAEVATFLPPEDLQAKVGGYTVAAAPKLYAGQEIHARVATGDAAGRLRLYVRAHTAGGLELRRWDGPWQEVRAEAGADLRWIAPAADGWPLAVVGLEWQCAAGGRLWLRSLTWDGQPTLTLEVPASSEGSTAPWTAAFVHNLDAFAARWLATWNLIKNHGVGIAHTGGRDWRDYEVAADLKPIVGDDFGLLARVQGLTRYYGAVFYPKLGKLRLVRTCHTETILAEAVVDWESSQTRHLSLTVRGYALRAMLDGQTVLEATDHDELLDGGGAGWRIADGRLESGALQVTAAGSAVRA